MSGIRVIHCQRHSFFHQLNQNMYVPIFIRTIWKWKKWAKKWTCWESHFAMFDGIISWFVKSCTWFHYTFKFIISTKWSITPISNCALITTQTFCSAPSALALLCIAFIPTVFTRMFQRCYRLGGWECHNFIFKNFNSEKFRN